MDENKKTGQENPDDFDFDNFFDSFENFEPFEAFESEEKKTEQKQESAPAQESAEEDLNFINSAKQDIDDIISSYSEPEKDSAPQVEIPAGTQQSFNINISPKNIKRNQEADDYTPSVTFIPDDAVNINDIPGYEIETHTTKKEEKPKKKKASTSEIVRRVVLSISIIVIVLSAAYLLKSYILDPYMSEKKNTKAAGDLIVVENFPEGTKESEMWDELKKKYPGVEFAPDMLIKYANLYAANPDLRGWITIAPFGIDMPLAQGADNSYYLKRDIYKKWTEYGVPYFDYRNSTYLLDRNTIVYGHNMKYSDKIFGMLEDYKTVDGFKRAPTIQCNTIYEDYTWKIYAVFITNSEAKDDNGYVFNYTFTRLPDEKFKEYISYVDKRALYTTGVDILPTDNILTLSTCCYDFDSAKIVVLARLVRDGESAEVDTSKAKTNPNPQYPQAWYDAYGKTNPYANAGRWYAK